jgi:hypothetical protein
MLKVSDAHQFRKAIAGISMVIAPVLLFVAILIHPGRRSADAAQFALVSGHSSRWLVATIIGMVALLFSVPAILGLMHMLRERRVAYGHVGGALVLVGTLAVSGLLALQLVLWQMATGAFATDQMQTLLHTFSTSAATFIPFYLLSLLVGLGFCVLAYGLYQARAVDWWEAATVAGAAVLLDIGGIFYSNLLFAIGAAVMIVGLGAVGLRVMSETEEEWIHTPSDKPSRLMAGLH